VVLSRLNQGRTRRRFQKCRGTIVAAGYWFHNDPRAFAQ
jgi:hypothetical protein